MDHEPAYNPFGVVKSWRIVDTNVIVDVKLGSGSLTLAAASAVRKFADDASSAFIGDMLRRYTEADVARSNTRSVEVLMHF